MKRMLGAIWMLAACALSCLGQTNGSAGTSLEFSLPPLRLRAELQAASEKAASTSNPSVSTPSTTPTQIVELESSLADTELHSRILRSGEFYLVRAERPSDSGVVRLVENIFTPEVVHIGKVPVSCSIVTAIKRKNPLCLLNPYFFQAWW